MRRVGLRGVMRGKVVRRAVADAKAACPLDRIIRRQGTAAKPAVGQRFHVLGMLESVSWRNHHRSLEPLGHTPPAEAEPEPEADYYTPLSSQAVPA